MTMIQVPRLVSHLSTREVIAQCRERHGEREITDAAAATIASWWQSSGTEGSAFAALASGATADASALMRDVSAAVRDTAINTDDRLAIEMLATWILAAAAAADAAETWGITDCSHAFGSTCC